MAAPPAHAEPPRAPQPSTAGEPVPARAADPRGPWPRRATRRAAAALGLAAAIAAASIATRTRTALGPTGDPPNRQALVGVRRAPPAVDLAEDDEDDVPRTLDEQRQRLFARMQRELELSDEVMQRVEDIFAASPILGQGNPAISHHPMSRSICRQVRARAGAVVARVPVCGAPGMVPLPDDTGATRACIDQLEFPNIACEYPVVHVRAREAALLCRAIGKRLCDAHEWEGACAGALHEPDADYEWTRPLPEAAWHHNTLRERVWSYGREKNHAICATGSFVTPGCPGGGFDRCGSNTYPAGAFPACRSQLGVYDLHGNVAEHMSLPLVPDELSSHGDKGFTEMKGSWFVFASVEAHEDDCRWRAPGWHRTRLLNEMSHANYHLGFRCCNDVDEGG